MDQTRLCFIRRLKERETEKKGGGERSCLKAWSEREREEDFAKVFVGLGASI